MQNEKRSGQGRKFFIQEHLQKKVFHGGIGNVDIERILLKNGFEPVLFPYHFDFSLKAKWFRYQYLIHTIFSLPEGAVVFFQFPLYAKMHKLLLRLLRFRPSIKVICLLADINGLKDGNEKVMREELEIIKSFKYFIVHGEPMDRWLKAQVPDAITSCLYFFDFLAKPSMQERQKDSVIAFAGNLAKSPFLAHLQQLKETGNPLRFNLYGPEVTDAMISQSVVDYKGEIEPYQLPSVIEGAFGLLWDGESTDGAGGSIGEYMQYISHHKLSLYILAGLPLIVYEKAGSADMVKTLNIGITISSIAETGEKISQLTEQDYQLMRANMKSIAGRISSGDYLQAALLELYSKMELVD